MSYLLRCSKATPVAKLLVNSCFALVLTSVALVESVWNSWGELTTLNMMFSV